jgi:hypothetical protein
MICSLARAPISGHTQAYAQNPAELLKPPLNSKKTLEELASTGTRNQSRNRTQTKVLHIMICRQTANSLLFAPIKPG